MKTGEKSSQKKTVIKAEKSNTVKLKSLFNSQSALKLCGKSNRNNSGPTCTTPVISWINVGCEFRTQNDVVSARKLAALIWHFHYVNNNNYNNHDHHSARTRNPRKHVAASPMQHHQPAERNKHALQPLSPASYGSSLETAPYNLAANADNSIVLRERIGESSYSFKTSTELLKVLNRIWNLEEQHIANASLVRGLKTELQHARARIKSLLRDQRANHYEIDEYMRNFSENSLAWKSKDSTRINAALQSARDELDGERKLRKRSESLRRKLAEELFEVKVALTTSVKEFEKEKKSVEVLEELCDEFAKGIREYARQVHISKQKPSKDWTRMTDHDNLILHMSESWLDERAQIKGLETQDRSPPRQPVTDRLRCEIETFLEARQLVDTLDTRVRRFSLESIPEAVTGPLGSAYSDLHGEEVNKAGPSNYEEYEKLALKVIRNGEGHSFPSGEVSTDVNMLQRSDIYDTVEEQRKKAYIDKEGHGSNSKTAGKLVSELTSESGSLPAAYEYQEKGSSNQGIRRNLSPVRQWMTSMASPDPRSYEASSKKQSIKDNTLKGRFEPKSKKQRSRLKIL